MGKIKELQLIVEESMHDLAFDHFVQTETIMEDCREEARDDLRAMVEDVLAEYDMDEDDFYEIFNMDIEQTIDDAMMNAGWD